jgi:LysM repeat protein
MKTTPAARLSVWVFLGIALLLCVGIAYGQAGNLLTNPGFEQPFPVTEGNPPMQVAEGWSPWYVPRTDGMSFSENLQPEYNAATNIVDGVGVPQIREGSDAQQFFSYFGTFTGGVLQQVNGATPGIDLTFSVYAYIWSTTMDDPAVSQNPGGVVVQVGIDPTGGTDGESSDIVWSPALAPVYDVYIPYSVTTAALGETVTVFVRAVAETPIRNNVVYLDDASLYATTSVGAPEGTAITGATDEATETSGEVVVIAPTGIAAETETPQEIATGSAGIETEAATPSVEQVATDGSAAVTEAAAPESTLAATSITAPEVTLNVQQPTSEAGATEDVGAATQPAGLVTDEAASTADTGTEAVIPPTATETPLPPTSTDTPTETASPVPTDTPTPVPTDTPTHTNTPTATFTPSMTFTLTPSPTVDNTQYPGRYIYTVQRGDTVAAIATTFNSSIAAIIAANGLNENGLIFVGQSLIVPVILPFVPPTNTPTPLPATPFPEVVIITATFTSLPAQPQIQPTAAVAPTVPPQPLPEQATTVPGQVETITYVVRPGDTLTWIAVRYNTTVNAIVELNNIRNPNLIYPGQRLLIPVGGTAQVVPAVPTAIVIPTTTGGNQMPAPPAMTPTQTYVVQPGDNLYTIAIRFNVPLDELIAANSLPNPNQIYIGQVLIIP